MAVGGLPPALCRLLCSLKDGRERRRKCCLRDAPPSWSPFTTLSGVFAGRFGMNHTHSRDAFYSEY